jgi:hypothetical protein
MDQGRTRVQGSVRSARPARPSGGGIQRRRVVQRRGGHVGRATSPPGHRKDPQLADAVDRLGDHADDRAAKHLPTGANLEDLVAGLSGVTIASIRSWDSEVITSNGSMPGFSRRGDGV